jgi:hypothetical protein
MQYILLCRWNVQKQITDYPSHTTYFLHFFLFSSSSFLLVFLFLFFFFFSLFFFFYGASPLFRAMAFPVFFLQVSLLLTTSFQFRIGSKYEYTAFLPTASSHSSFKVSHRHFFSAEHPHITYWGVR